jgi:hypothetical protein
MLWTRLETRILVFQQFSASVERLKYFVTMNYAHLKASHNKCGLWSMRNGTQDYNLTGDLIASAAHYKLIVLVPCVRNLRCGFRALLYVIYYYKHECNTKWRINSWKVTFFLPGHIFSSISEHLEIQPSLSASNSYIFTFDEVDKHRYVRLQISCFNLPP